MLQFKNESLFSLFWYTWYINKILYKFCLSHVSSHPSTYPPLSNSYLPYHDKVTIKLIQKLGLLFPKLEGKTSGTNWNYTSLVLCLCMTESINKANLDFTMVRYKTFVGFNPSSPEEKTSVPCWSMMIKWRQIWFRMLID